MGLQLKYTGLGIVYILFWHVMLMMPSWWRSRTWRLEDDARAGPEIEDKCSPKGWKARQLVHQHLSGLLCSLAQGRDRSRKAWHRLDRPLSSLFCPIELSTCSVWGTWCACVYLVLKWQQLPVQLVVSTFQQLNSIWSPLTASVIHSWNFSCFSFRCAVAKVKERNNVATLCQHSLYWRLL